MDPLVVEILDGPDSLGEVPRQPVDSRDHDHVAGLEGLPERIPSRPAHIPARGDVGVDPVVSQPVVSEDAALGGQAALPLGLGDADVAEGCWFHIGFNR